MDQAQKDQCLHNHAQAGWISKTTDPTFRGLVGQLPVLYNTIYKLYICIRCHTTVRDVQSHFGSDGPHDHLLGATHALAFAEIFTRFPEGNPYDLLPGALHQPRPHIPLIPFAKSGYRCHLCTCITLDLVQMQQHATAIHRGDASVSVYTVPNIQRFFEESGAPWFLSSPPDIPLPQPAPSRDTAISTQPTNPPRPPHPTLDTQRYPSPAPSGGSDGFQTDGEARVSSGPAPPPSLPVRPAQPQPAPQPLSAPNPPPATQHSNAQLGPAVTAAASIITGMRNRISALEHTSVRATTLIEQQRVQIEAQDQRIVQLATALDLAKGVAFARAAKQDERIDALLLRVDQQDKRMELLQEEGERVGEALAKAVGSAQEHQTKQAEMRAQLDKLELLRGSVGQYVKKNEARAEGWDGRLGVLERSCADRVEREVRDVGVGPEQVGGTEDFSPVPLKTSPKGLCDVSRDEVDVEVDVQLDVEVEGGAGPEEYWSGVEEEEVEEEATPPDTQLPDYDEDDISIFAPSPSQSDEDDWVPRKSANRAKKRSLRRIMSEEASEVGEAADVPVEKVASAKIAPEEPAAATLGRDAKKRRMGEEVQDGRVNRDEPNEQPLWGLEQPPKAHLSSNGRIPSSPTSPAPSPRYAVPLRRLPVPRWKRL